MDLEELLAAVLVARARGRDRSESLREFGHDRGGLAAVQPRLLGLDPRGALGRALPMDRAARVPELLDDVHHVDCVNRFREQALDPDLEMPVAVGEHLHRARRPRRQAALGRFASCHFDGVAGLREGRVVALVDGPEQQLALAAQRVHHNHRSHLRVLGLVALLAARLEREAASRSATAMPWRRGNLAALSFAAASCELGLGGRRHAFAVDLDHEHIAVVGWRGRALEPLLRVPPVAQHRRFDHLGRWRRRHKPAEQQTNVRERCARGEPRGDRK